MAGCVVAVDVGGTSAAVCLAEAEQPTLTTEGEVADLPLPFPMLDVHSIGAGGGSLARRLNCSVEAAAHGMLDILNNTMAGAMRAMSIERGYDPRDFVLLACGGAGPLQAGRLAELLEMPTVIIPRYSGVLSTLGLLHSDVKNDYVRTVLQRHNAVDRTALNTACSDLEGQARRWLTEAGTAPTTPGMPLPHAVTRAVYFPNIGGFVECPVYDDAALPPGARLIGPAIITQDLSTIVVEPQHQVHLDRYGNLIMAIPHRHA